MREDELSEGEVWERGVRKQTNACGQSWKAVRMWPQVGARGGCAGQCGRDEHAYICLYTPVVFWGKHWGEGVLEKRVRNPMQLLNCGNVIPIPKDKII